MRHLPPTRISILADRNRYYLDVRIADADYSLGAYDNVSDCAAAMVKWLTDRGLTTALGSAYRLAEAQRLNACSVTFDVVHHEEPDQPGAIVQ